MSDKVLPWFRMYSRIMTDPDIEFLAFEDQRHYVWLLCMKSEGYLDKGYDRTRMDIVVGRKLGLHGEALANAKTRIMETGLIDEDWQPRNWNDLQFKSDSSKDRVAAFRKRQKKQGYAGEKRFSNVTVTAQETDTEKEKERVSNSQAKPTPPKTGMSREDHNMVIDLYEEIVPTLPSVLRSRWYGSANAQQLQARWREDKRFRSPEFWRAFFETVSENSWWMGIPDNGRRFDKCNLAWLVKRGNFDKVLDRAMQEAS